MTTVVQGVTINTGIYINGKWKQGKGEILESVNPTTEEIITKVSLLTPLFNLKPESDSSF